MTCSGNKWEIGWIILTDEDTVGVVDGIDEVLRVKNAYKRATTVSASIPKSGGNKFIEFGPMEIMVVHCLDCVGNGALASPLKYVAVAARWAGKTLTRLVGINDAVAGGGSGKGGGNNDNGGLQSGCSDQQSSNSPNSGNSKPKLMRSKMDGRTAGAPACHNLGGYQQRRVASPPVQVPAR